MARNTNVPFKGRIQKRKTNHLQIITFGLQRAAGPYRSCHTKAQGISSPGTHEAISMWPRNDGEQQWNATWDWTCLALTNRNRINTLALGARLPTIYGVREFVEAGGFASYGPSFPALYRRAAARPRRRGDRVIPEGSGVEGAWRCAVCGTEGCGELEEGQ
jgi:hypothetical protein